MILACIRTCVNPDLREPLIKRLINDTNKIDSYIWIGNLTAAYLLAVRLNRDADVKRILIAAKRTGKEKIKNMCTVWLETYHKESDNPFDDL